MQLHDAHLVARMPRHSGRGENANEHREEAKRNRGGRVHALIAKRESQSTLILIYVSQTSTEMEQSGIEVGVRAMKKKRGARCCLQQTDSSF